MEELKKYLHTIGNLTLTGYNSELSNKSFREKRDMKGGFKDSPIRMNKFLASLDKWDLDAFEKRYNNLVMEIIKIWKFPEVKKETLEKYKKEDVKHKYNIEDFEYLKEGKPMRNLFFELRKRILNIDSSIYEEPQKLYIAYKSERTIVSIIPQKNALKLKLNINLDELDDPLKKCEDIKDKSGWGYGNTEFKLIEEKDLDYAINLIKKIYDKNKVNYEEDS